MEKASPLRRINEHGLSSGSPEGGPVARMEAGGKSGSSREGDPKFGANRGLSEHNPKARRGNHLIRVRVKNQLLAGG